MPPPTPLDIITINPLVAIVIVIDIYIRMNGMKGGKISSLVDQHIMSGDYGGGSFQPWCKSWKIGSFDCLSNNIIMQKVIKRFYTQGSSV